MDPQDEIDSYFLSTLSRVLGEFGLTLDDVEIDTERKTMNVVTKISREKSAALARALADTLGTISV